MLHHIARTLLENVAVTQHESAVRDETVERIAHEGKLEIAKGVFAEIGTHLSQRQMAMPDCRQIFPRETFVDKKSDLLDVFVAQLLAQRLPYRMGAGLWHCGEDETMAMGNDQVKCLQKWCHTSRWWGTAFLSILRYSKILEFVAEACHVGRSALGLVIEVAVLTPELRVFLVCEVNGIQRKLKLGVDVDEGRGVHIG